MDKDEEEAGPAGEAGGTHKPPFMTANHLAVNRANGAEATNRVKLTEEARAMSSSQSNPKWRATCQATRQCRNKWSHGAEPQQSDRWQSGQAGPERSSKD